MTGELETLVAIVVAIVRLYLAQLGQYDASKHDGQVDGLHLQVVLVDGHVSEYDLEEEVFGLLHFGLLVVVVARPLARRLHLGADEVERLQLREHLQRVHLVETRRERLVYELLGADELHDLLVGRDAERLEYDADGDVLHKTVVLQVVLARLFAYGRLRFGRVRRALFI